MIENRIAIQSMISCQKKLQILIILEEGVLSSTKIRNEVFAVIKNRIFIPDPL